MKQTTRLALALGIALAAAAGAPASRRPCLDAHGKAIPCPKAKAPAPPRCKDEKGRFVRCDKPGAPPAADRN